MTRYLRSHAIALLLLLACRFLPCASETRTRTTPDEESIQTAAVGDENVTTAGDHHKDQLIVQDYLEALSNEELEKICLDRGFSIARDVDHSMERQDYLTAARRCLSLEDEMNAIIAAHPELAAELDAEIERMRQHKLQLEKERDEILAQKALLEEQLAQAGMTLNSSVNRTSTSVAQLDPENMSVEEVLRHSFTLLYQRVMQDVKMVRKVLDPLVFQPVGRGSRLLWKYSKPTILSLWIQARTKVQAYIAPAHQENATNTAIG